MTSVQIPYPHRMGGHCGSSSLRDLAEWSGLRWGGSAPGEGLIFTLGGALAFSYSRSESLVPPVYLVGRGAGMEGDFLHRIGASTLVRSTEDPVAGWNWVRDEIDRGKPVLLWADIAELPYLKVRLPMSRHDIVVVGYDDQSQTVTVADNDRKDLQQVTYEALRRSRSSQGFPVPTRHTTYIIDWPRQTLPLRVIAGSALTQAAATMQDADALEGLVVVGQSGLNASGLAGVSSFCADLGRWGEHFDTDLLQQALWALSALIEKAGTGGGLFRRLQAEGCRELATVLASREAAEAAEAADAAARLWTALARAAVVPTSSPRECLASCISLAAGLPAAEERLAAALSQAGHSLAFSVAGGSMC